MNEDLETHLKLLNGELLPDNKETIYIFELFRTKLKKEIEKSNVYIKEILLRYELRDDCIINLDREQKAINIIGVDSFKLCDLLLDKEIDTFKTIESQSIAFSTLGFLYAVRSLFFLYFDQLQQALHYYTVAIKYLNTGEVLRHKDEMLLDEIVNIHNKGGDVRSKQSKENKKLAMKLWDQGKYSTFIECGRAIHTQLGITDPNTIARWLSEGTKARKNPTKTWLS